MPHSPETRAAVEAAVRHPAGRSRAQVAKEFGVDPRTVQRWATAIGITDAWDTRRTAAATQSAGDRRRAARSDLADEAMRRARDFLAQLDQPFLAFSFGGKDNVYNEHTLPGPPTGDIKNLLTAFGIAVDKHLALDKHDATSGHEDTAGVLAQLSAELAAAARHAALDETTPTDQP